MASNDQVFNSLEQPKGWFTTTHWSVVLAAGDDGPSTGRAQKRGGGQPAFSLDEVDAEDRYRLEPADEATPERIFDRRWAFTVLDQAAARRRREHDAADKAALYSSLKGFVSAESTPSSYEDAARSLGLSQSAVKSAIHRLRQRYQELIRDEIAQTVTSASEIDEEIRHLLAVIRGS